MSNITYKLCSSTYATELTLFAQFLYPDTYYAASSQFVGLARADTYLVFKPTQLFNSWRCNKELSELYDATTKHNT